jgi:hypothetical protein
MVMVISLWKIGVAAKDKKEKEKSKRENIK